MSKPIDRWMRLRSLLSRRGLEREVDEELEFHIESLVRDYIEKGMSPREARRRALRRFGSVGRVKHEGLRHEGARVRQRRRFLLLDGLSQDIRYSLRTLLKNPLFTSAAVISLAIGIGANSAVFSFLHGFLIDPLPFKDSGRLVSVMTLAPTRGRNRWAISYPEFLDLQRESRSFKGLAAYGMLDVTLTGGEEPERLMGSRVSYNLFDLLGYAPLHGRSFIPEDEGEGMGGVVILHYGVWQRAFGGDPEVIGRTIFLSGEPHTVVGVMPSNLDFPPVTNMWVPIQADPSGDRGRRAYRLLGALEKGVSLEEAQVEMDSFSERFQQAYPVENEGVTIHLESLKEDLLDDTRAPVLILYAIVSLVLLLACANVANLLLSRGAARRREIAVRVSLGATRRRIIGQLLTESLVLAVAGGALGLVLGRIGRDLVLRSMPTTPPSYFTFEIDLAVVGILTGIVLLCTLLFGLVPAVITTRPGLEGVLRGSDRLLSQVGKRRGFQPLLVSLEIVMAVLVTVAAGLMIKSFIRMQTTEQGFNSRDVLTMEINLGNVGYEDPASRVRFFDDLIDRIRQHPDVLGVGAANPMPHYGWEDAYRLEDSVPAGDEQTLTAIGAVVTPGYFQALEIPLLRGRDFGDTDYGPDSLPVAIVSETFARVNWPGSDPIGKRFQTGRDSFSSETWLEVIGVVGDTHAGTFDTPRGWFYRPQGQLAFWELILAIRSRVDPLEMIDHVKGLVWSIEPNLALHWNSVLETDIRERFWQPPLFSWALGIFSFFALIMACVGVYGVVAFAVVRRSQEFGVRLSIGARPVDVVLMVIRQGGWLVLWGLVGGLAGAVVFMQLAATLFYGVSPTDPGIYILCTIVIAATALLACYVPARRAARIDPVTALRSE